MCPQQTVGWLRTQHDSSVLLPYCYYGCWRTSNYNDKTTIITVTDLFINKIDKATYIPSLDGTAMEAH